MTRAFRHLTILFRSSHLRRRRSYADVKTRDERRSSSKACSAACSACSAARPPRKASSAPTAVKGNRKATMNDSTGQIVDLVGREGLRPRHEEEDLHGHDVRGAAPADAGGARRRPKKEAEKEEPSSSKQEAAEAAEGIRGRLRRQGDRPEEAARRLRHARSRSSTITVREKGKTLEDSGGFVMTTDLWLGPQIPQLKEIGRLRHAATGSSCRGPDVAAMSAEQMATVHGDVPAGQARRWSACRRKATSCRARRSRRRRRSRRSRARSR